MDKYESQHNKTMEHYAMLIQQLFGIALNDFIQAATLASDDYSGNEIFNFDNYPITRAAVQNIVNTLANNVNATVINGCKAVWDISNKKNNALVDELFKGKTLTDEQKIRYFQNNESALKAFTERKYNGLRLSDRVWNIVGGYKNDIENALSVSIEKGQSAHALAKEVQQYLNEPNKLFRRVRDEFGELQLSKNAKNYHPGQGVYRSSYKNAMRLARTEINMAYHTADNTRWQQFDFVVGIEIKTSHNHPEQDICDQLAGRYPKDFKFVGWHPHCRCYQKSILKTEEEMDKDADRMRQHEEPTAKSVNSVSDVPDGFKGWVSDNEEKIKRAKNKPYFITDNKQYVNTKDGYKSVFSNSEVDLKPSKIKDLSEVENKIAKIVNSNPEYFSHGYKGINAISESKAYMRTDIKGKISINFASDENGFNAGDNIVSAFSKIKDGSELSEQEEYSIEILWHEILHNKSKNTAVLPEINSPLGFTRTVAETINQLVARHTYPKFLKKLGGAAKNFDWIMQNGYGYNYTVQNLRVLLQKANINETTFIKRAEKILMQDYTDIDVKIVSILEEMYKGTLNIKWLFCMIEHKDFLKILD